MYTGNGVQSNFLFEVALWKKIAHIFYIIDNNFVNAVVNVKVFIVYYYFYLNCITPLLSFTVTDTHSQT